MKYVSPNKKISREVIDSDLEKIAELAPEMVAFCEKPAGKKTGAYAIAHCQIDEIDPMRFFVMRTAYEEVHAIINPEIINHTKTKIDSIEGCMSYPDKDDIVVQRYNKVTVKYYYIETTSYGKKDGPAVTKYELKERTDNFGGKLARIFQHEVLGHMEGKNIYDDGI